MKEMWKNINKKYIVIGLFILLAVLVIVLGMVGVNSLNNIKCTSETTVGEITIKDEEKNYFDKIYGKKNKF